MDSKTENNFAYIDGANLYNGITGFGWTLDYARFRVWLTEKYRVKISYVNDQRSHLELVKKEKAPDGDKTPQGSFS